MPSPRPIHDIIDDIQNLHSESVESDDDPYIIEHKLRGPTHYLWSTESIAPPRWDTRRVGGFQNDEEGPPRLIPSAENEYDTDGQVIGLNSWPVRDSRVEAFIDEREGIDALAWYRSFHYAPVERWGIYMLDKGIYSLAQHFARQYDPALITPELRLSCVHDAVDLLYFHELFHFYVDLAAARLEILEGRPRYLNYFQNRYREGWQTRDGAPARIPQMLEEALANEYARSVTARGRSTDYKSTLDEFMRRQPDGYRHWKAVGHKIKWSNGLSELGERLLNPTTPLPPYLRMMALENAVDSFYRGQVPVYLVDTFDPGSEFEFIPPMVVVDDIKLHPDVEKQAHSRKTPHDVRKQFLNFIHKLKQLGHVRSHRRLNKANKPGHYFWDVTSGWRALLVQTGMREYTVSWLGDHNAYQRLRKANSL